MKKEKVQYRFLGIFFLICLYFFVSVSYAQDSISVPSKRPTVGLVLSGGGAKGMAHIGVIQALEEAGIPIDYITGTSIGAVIGGLYAAGYSTQEMETIFLSSQFSEWIKGNIDEKYTYFFKKQETTSSWIEPNLRITPEGVKLKLPTNVVSPLVIDFEFMNIYAGASILAKNNFDSLFVPFSCVASDLTNQRPYHFHSGDLGSAIRASMTVPFYFNPLLRDSILFFDGGIYNNFPVKEMQHRYHPDIIIGSKVANNFPAPQEGDPISYLQKMITNETEYDLLGTKGVIIEPKIPSGMNILDFSETCKYVSVGYQSVVKQIDSIKNMVQIKVPQSEVEEKRKQFKKQIPSTTIDSIKIVGGNPYQEEYIRNILHGRKDAFSNLEQFRANYFRLFSDYNIKMVHPQLIYDTTMHSTYLQLDVKIEDILSPKIGGYLAVGTPSEAFVGLEFRQLRRVGLLAEANAYLGRYYNSISVDTRLDYASKRPFYTNLNYTYNYWNYSSSELFTSSVPPITQLKQTEQHISLELGMPTGFHSKLSLTPSFNIEDDSYKITDVISIDDKPDKSTFRFASITLSAEKNTLNKPQYAWKGFYYNLALAGVYGREEHFPEGVAVPDGNGIQNHAWFQTKFEIQQYFKLQKRYSLGLSFEMSGSTQEPFLTLASTLLHMPSFAPTVESSLKFFPEYSANNYLAPGVQNVFHVWDQLYLRAEAYLFMPLNVQFSFDSPFFTYERGSFIDAYRGVFSIGSVYYSPIGPISLLVNYHSRNGDINPWSFIFNIGYVFFNKRGLER